MAVRSAGGAFCCVDNHKGKRTSLHATDEEQEARQIVEARNQSERQQGFDLPDPSTATNFLLGRPGDYDLHDFRDQEEHDRAAKVFAHRFHIS